MSGKARWGLYLGDGWMWLGFVALARCMSRVCDLGLVSKSLFVCRVYLSVDGAQVHGPLDDGVVVGQPLRVHGHEEGLQLRVLACDQPKDRTAVVAHGVPRHTRHT